LIPPNKTIEDFKILMEEINSECIEHDLEILGGHTEVTNVVNDIVISATIIGTGNENDIVRTSTSKKGDLIFITKPLGIEGTILLFDTVKDKLSLDYYDDIKKFREWLSVRKESMILRISI
ncbi:Putative AIR synthase related protein, partial [Candidatus Arthromitus sp. SFB-4]